MLIGYENGTVVFWDLKSKRAELRVYYDEVSISTEIFEKSIMILCLLSTFTPCILPIFLFLESCLILILCLTLPVGFCISFMQNSELFHLELFSWVEILPWWTIFKLFWPLTYIVSITYLFLFFRLHDYFLPLCP